MGESTVDPPKSEDKMGSVGEPTLEVSVSFGRFEKDLLSWDRWSSFSQNKYLEEVEKCSTPGSVAMKKAYFEAHYKKIAAKKAALMDQQAEMEYDPVKSDTPNGDVESEVYVSKDQCFTEEIIDKTLNGNVESEMYTSNEQYLTKEIVDKTLNGDVEPESDTTNDQCSTDENNVKMINGNLESEVYTSNGQCFIKELMEKISFIGKENNTSVNTRATVSESSSVEEWREQDSRPDTPCSLKPDEDILVIQNTEASESSVSVQDNTEASQYFDEEKTQAPKINKTQAPKINKTQAPKISKDILKKDLSTKPKKTTKVIKERIVAWVPKKAASPLAKTVQLSTPRVSKPLLTSTTPSVVRSAQSSTKKGTNFSLLKSSNFSTGERRRVVPSSLHMSYSSDPRKLDLDFTPATVRKSMIMEKMGDKDIVKRAFRSFQSSVNQLKSSTEEISSLPNQMQRKVPELKVSSSAVPRKDERSYKAGANGKSATTVSSSTNLRNNATTDTRKKLVKKLDEKSSTKEADKPLMRSKVKDQKDVEIKKMRQSLNFKATPLPNFYKGQQPSKILLNKDSSNNGTVR